MNGPTGIAIDRKGVLHVADSKNYLIRKISPTAPSTETEEATGPLIQPSNEDTASREVTVVPKIDVARVVGEARGAPGGVALDHLHSGLDIHGSAGEAALSVYDEKVSSPIANWDFE